MHEAGDLQPRDKKLPVASEKIQGNFHLVPRILIHHKHQIVHHVLHFQIHLFQRYRLKCLRGFAFLGHFPSSAHVLDVYLGMGMLELVVASHCPLGTMSTLRLAVGSS